jgi:hypothetical protein
MGVKQIVGPMIAFCLLVTIAIGCFKLGAEFCPPTVVIERTEDGRLRLPRLVRDGGLEQ